MLHLASSSAAVLKYIETKLYLYWRQQSRKIGKDEVMATVTAIKSYKKTTRSDCGEFVSRDCRG